MPSDDPRHRRYVEPDTDGEDATSVELPKGDVTEGVVRVGATARRPRQAQSPFVEAYLRHLEAVGFDGAPRFLGVDDRGRDVLDYVEGDVPGAPPEAWACTDEVVAGIGRLVRRPTSMCRLGCDCCSTRTRWRRRTGRSCSASRTAPGGAAGT